uniref:CTCHY-type domain-containing protein n=1 Tax=Ditylenchus dipsaci TaxID=166011 RepID=A0A915DKF6_9BILA
MPVQSFVLPGDVIQDYVKVSKISSVPINEYGKIRRSFDSFSFDGTCCWCSHCINYMAPTYSTDAALQKNQEEAQYWFTEETLNVISNALTEDGIDSVLCIGTPTLFDFLQKASSDQPVNGKRCFLLDFDDRMAHFYGADEFARYSMLNNHFYNADSRNELIKFFARVGKVGIVCDPPFGVFIDALMKSLGSLKEMIRTSSEINNSSDMSTMLVLPIFVGKHVLKDPSFSMVDFKVTYENHKAYSKPDSSVVRIFTDVRNNAFVLSSKHGYRFCEKCDRYVAQDNLHCLKCAKCPSRDGSKYIHCSACSRCVKSIYKHCTQCKTCHLPSRHIVNL